MQVLRTSFRERMETLRNDASLTKEQKRTKMEELMKDQQTQLKSILTAEQIQKMESFKKDRPVRNTK